MQQELEQPSIEATIQSLAPSAANYLVSKPALMNSPGIKLHDVYYTAANTSVDLAEITYNMGRYKPSLSNLQFGSGGQVQIPNSSLVGGIFLHLTLNLNSAANVSLPRGWGYAAIQSINYQLGSSNANQQQINGQTMLQIIDQQAGSQEKMSEIFALGGQEQLTPVGVVSADVFLPFPWSTACASDAKLPFDSAMLNSQIYLTVNFNPVNYFIGGSGVKPTSFANATIYCRQGEFYNKDMSLGMVIKRDPTLIYGYPFIHHQSLTPSALQVTSGQTVSVPLLSILNADLVGLSFGVIKQTDLSPTTSSPNPFNYLNVTDIQLTFNGQVMYETPGAMDRLVSCYMINGAAFFFNSLIAAGSTSPFTSSPINTYIRHLDFSRTRDACFGKEFANTWRIGNNALTLQFTSPVTDTVLVFVTYHYNGIVDVQNGESRLIY